jgi:hypothetical protein
LDDPVDKLDAGKVLNSWVAMLMTSGAVGFDSFHFTGHINIGYLFLLPWIEPSLVVRSTVAQMAVGRQNSAYAG